MGTLFVDKLDPQSGTSLELGSSGDTLTVPSGATLTVAGTINASSGTATGFGGAALTNDFRMSIFYANNNQSISANTGTTITGYWTNSNITSRFLMPAISAALFSNTFETRTPFSPFFN